MADAKSLMKNRALANRIELNFFGATWANVPAALLVRKANCRRFLACLKSRRSILGFDLSHGGQLETHGSPVNFSGKAL